MVCEEGVLTGITDGTLKANSFLTWKGSTIRNFDLRVQVRVTPGGNSGIHTAVMRPDLGLYAASDINAMSSPRTPVQRHVV